MQLEERFVAPAFAPEYLAQDFTRMTTNFYLQRIVRPTELEQVVFAVIPDAETATLLEMGEHEACLLLLRRTWAAAVPATRSLFTHPGSRYSLGSRYRVGRSAKRG
ncbi:MAG TPA: UTRA domain-containing protein [Rhodanobacter sp.]|nr:UTRA domain-containing protein [Rhodanobacter sp.]